MNKPKYFLIPIIALVITGFPACLPEDDGDPFNDPRDKFIATWKVAENCTRGNYSSTISADPSNSSQVLISNFGNPGPGYDPAVGLVVGSTVFVSSQTIGESWTVSGEGIYDTGSNTISWTYSLDIAGSNMSCTAEYWQ